MRVESNYELRIRLDDNVKLVGRMVILTQIQAKQLSREIERELQYAPSRDRSRPLTAESKPATKGPKLSGEMQRARNAARMRFIRAGDSNATAKAKAEAHVADLQRSAEAAEVPLQVVTPTPQKKKPTAAPKKAKKHRRGPLSAALAAALYKAIERGDNNEQIKRKLGVSDRAIGHYTARLELQKKSAVAA